MRTSTSFAALVTLMAVVGSGAAPIGPDRSSDHVPSPMGGHKPNHGVFPVSGFKISNRDTSHIISTCDSKSGLTEGVKPVTASADDKVKDMGKATQNEMRIPDIKAHIDIDVNEEGDKTEPRPQPEPEPKPESQSEPETKPNSESSHESEHPGNGPDQSGGNAGSCLDPNKFHERLQAGACATVNIKDEKGPNVAHKGADRTGNEAKAELSVILGKIHEVHNKPVNAADDIEKEVHVVGNVDLGTDAVKAIGSYKSALAIVNGDIEGVNLIQDGKH
ncbi:hypothetical protein RSOLAG1IB_04171 [Rhizoctonia solani AG-1 IB]|uniref:BON domain-containing protein n=1 Tax=Thanatephorus cucumeris (strain AG1-IB / isolate 7/3/14) TaxID=1108050 RepID=A0A0B7FXK5_THACB|nr:hypothetical protein RSOLAG1IB_04171 [Rhizoctonia solani AG-1 IB]